jgi:hypothetical protein
VRFRPEETDPFLFPAAAAALKDVDRDDLAPVYITYDHQLKFDAKDHKVRTYGISSWRRADGQERSKTCAWSRVAIVAAGPERGDAFRVCVNRDKCEVHFATSARAKARRTKARAGQPGAGAKPDARAEQEARRAAQDLRERAEKERWKKASRHLVRALSEKLKGLAITVDGTLWRAALRECTPHRHMAGLVPGRSLGSLVRYCVFQHLAAELTGYTWDPQGEWPRLLTPFGIDAKKIVDAAVPKPVPEKKQPATAAAKKKKGKK